MSSAVDYSSGLTELWPIMAASNGYSLGLSPQTLPDGRRVHLGFILFRTKKKELSAKIILDYKKYNKYIYIEMTQQ